MLITFNHNHIITSKVGFRFIGKLLASAIDREIRECNLLYYGVSKCVVYE